MTQDSRNRLIYECLKRMEDGEAREFHLVYKEVTGSIGEGYKPLLSEVQKLGYVDHAGYGRREFVITGAGRLFIEEYEKKKAKSELDIKLIQQSLKAHEGALKAQKWSKVFMIITIIVAIINILISAGLIDFFKK